MAASPSRLGDAGTGGTRGNLAVPALVVMDDSDGQIAATDTWGPDSESSGGSAHGAPGGLIERLDELAATLRDAFLGAYGAGGTTPLGESCVSMLHAAGREYAGYLLSAALQGEPPHPRAPFGCHRALGRILRREGLGLETVLACHEAACRAAFETLIAGLDGEVGDPQSARTMLAMLAKAAVMGSGRSTAALTEGFHENLQAQDPLPGGNALDELLDATLTASGPGSGQVPEPAWLAGGLYVLAVVALSTLARGVEDPGVLLDKLLSEIESADIGAGPPMCSRRASRLARDALGRRDTGRDTGRVLEIDVDHDSGRDLELIAAFPVRADGDGAGEDSAGEHACDKVEAFLSKALSGLVLPEGTRVAAGVGLAGTGPAGIRASYEQALESLRVACLSSERPGWRPGSEGLMVIGHRRALVPLLLLGDSARAAEIEAAVLGPLGVQAGRAPSEEAASLLAAASAFIAQGGNVLGAARRLGVHRHTLSTRLERFERLTGLVFDDPDDTLLVALALRAHELSSAALAGQGGRARCRP